MTNLTISDNAGVALAATPQRQAAIKREFKPPVVCGLQVPGVLASLRTRDLCGSQVSAGDFSVHAPPRLSDAVQGQNLVVPNDVPPKTTFVIAGKENVRDLFGANVRRVAGPFPTGEIAALDVGTLKVLRSKQKTQLRRFKKYPAHSVRDGRVLAAVSQPIDLPNLFRNRQSDRPLLVCLNGHALAARTMLADTSMKDIATSLKEHGLQNGDFIYLSACFGADSVDTDSTDPDALQLSAQGGVYAGRLLLPPAQHLANELEKAGLPDCFVVASHNITATWPVKDPMTRKITADQYAGQEFSGTHDMEQRASLLSTSRIFSSQAAPSDLLPNLNEKQQERFAPVISFLKRLTPPDLST